MTDHDAQDTDTQGQDSQRFDRVSEQLKVGFAAMATTHLSDEVKPDWHRRLIAITNASKHDLPTAEKRLQRFWNDWEEATGSRPPGT